MFSKLQQALKKASGLFRKTRDAPLDEIEEILLQADVGIKYTQSIIETLRTKENDIYITLKQELIRMLTIPLPESKDHHPLIILVCGVNGSGKTTSVAKLANLYKKMNTVLLVCGDTYRDAAREQLMIWASRTDVDIVASQKGQDAGAVVFDAMTRARSKSLDVVIIDTAGRLHTRIDLMDELKKIIRIINKFWDKGPHFKLLTIDASLGQNSIQQARIFKQEININGLVLTKCDGTAKGGAVVPICNELNVPILYLGIGEGIEDIMEFDAKTFVEALFAN